MPSASASLRASRQAAADRRRTQANAGIHANVAEELDASDGDGLQGGQGWDRPTASPTPGPTPGPTSLPTTAPTTAAPTAHPTLSDIEWLVRGEVWYDRNANGIRDSNVYIENMGNDVEWTHGLGGVRLQLVQCDPDTGRAYVPAAGEVLESFAGGLTQGVDARGKALIIPIFGDNGRFQMHLAPGTKARHYFVQAMVPSNADTPFLFTSGVCNDNEPGWGCDYPDQPALPAAANETVPFGISEGRSNGCLFVDRNGEVDRILDFGVMRQGDTQTAVADVALVLAFDEGAAGRRRLADVLGRARPLPADGTGVARYLLAGRDKDAIGTVTAEVLAATLDARLAQTGVELDAVNPKDVIVSDGGGGDTQLAVAMEIRGHYSPPPNLDFDYIVQDSINQDTTAIRRGLRDFNKNCREQTTKVREEGFREDDFEAVISTAGTKRGQKKQITEMNNVFSTACATDLLVPEYFETSLKDVGASDGKNPFMEQVTFVTHEAVGLMADWAKGPVAGVAGLIVLLMGMFVFRRALGPRRAAFSDQMIKDIDDGERRRFGEMGGDMDDGSVDSAFYSESDSDEEMTDKERRMRRKSKAKANDSNSKKIYKGGKKVNSKAREREEAAAKKGYRDEDKKAAKKGYRDEDEKKGYRDEDKKRSSRKASRRTLASSVSKSFTRSLTKKAPSTFTDEEGKPLAASQHTDSSEGSSEKSKRRARRGRSTRKGGDNANKYEDMNVV